MNQILPHPLWVGHVGEARDFKRVFDAGIEALVQLAAEEPPPAPPRDLICCHFPLLDSNGNRAALVGLAVRTVATLVRLRMPTLVTSGSGGSRGPAVAAAALSLVHQEPVEECLQRVVKYHPSDVSPGFWSDITGLLPLVQ
jgi:hypothetical protein